MINKKYNIEITVLSPLAIGAGAEKDWVKGIDFVVEDNKIYLLNLKKMQEAGIDLAKLTTHFANKNAEAVKTLIGNKLESVSDKVMPFPVNSDNDIKSYIKNELSGKPIIPGSSLKGAVRSVILDYLLNNTKPRPLNEKDYFGNSNKGDELMRFIKFSDAEFEETALVNTKIFNLQGGGTDWKGGWKHEFLNGTTSKYQPNGFNTLYESILPEQKGICSIMLSKICFDKIQNQIMKAEKEKLFSINELFEIINKHTKNYINKERAFFKKYSTDKTEKIIENLEQIKNQIPVDNSSCIFKMSAGSGFHSITGDWQYDKFTDLGTWNNGKQKYKSRKIACMGNDIFSLMGFVKLRVMSDTEVAQYEKDLAEQRTKQEIERKRIAEEKRIEQENKENAETERLAVEKIEQERLANLSPDEREKEKYQNAIKSEWGNLVNESLQKDDLTGVFFHWLKQLLDESKLWNVNINDKKDKWVKRCCAIETKINE